MAVKGGQYGPGRQDDEERASREATDWLILLQEAPDDAGLRRRFAGWLAERPENAAAWAATEHVSGVIGRAPPEGSGGRGAAWQAFPGARKTVGPPEGRVSPSPARRRVSPSPARSRGARSPARRIAGGLAALAVAACLALTVAPGILTDLRSDHATGTAEMRTVPLDDGSTVVLAPGSAIAVAYGAGERRIDLLAGEAFFDVARNPDRPFRVAADGIVATAVGTRFDVRRTGAGAAVAVEEGTVRVEMGRLETVGADDGAAVPVSELLEAGQSVHVARGGGVVRRSGASSQVASWRRNQIVAQDEPMEDVIDRLRRFYGGTIVLAGAGLAVRPVTGVYNLSDPVDAVRGVAHAHGAAVRRITPWILVVSER